MSKETYERVVRIKDGAFEGGIRIKANDNPTYTLWSKIKRLSKQDALADCQGVAFQNDITL
jgi:hypothetical protein